MKTKTCTGTMAMVLVGVFSASASAADHWWECGWKNYACFAPFLLPNGFSQVNTDKREWTASQGYVVGYNNVVEFRVRFDPESLQTLHHTPLGGYPFGLEVDIAEANGGSVLEFDYVTSDFPDSSQPVQDLAASDWINSDSNAEGLIVRDASKIEANHDYTVRFYLKQPIPAGGVEIRPSLQIVYDNWAVVREASRLGVHLSLGMTSDSRWNFFALEADNYNKGWKVYPDGHEGMRWTSKKAEDSAPTHNFVRNPQGVVYISPEMKQRYDYFDQVCRVTNPNFVVEQFRNAMTGRITIFKTPTDKTAHRYANANCATEPFSLSSVTSADGSGSGGGGGSKGKLPDLRERKTYVTRGKSSDATKVEESDRTFFGDQIWCQMIFDNKKGAADVTKKFDSTCYFSKGRRFDGWDKVEKIGSVRVNGLKNGKQKEESVLIKGFEYPGWYGVASFIDSRNEVKESEEDNNRTNADSPYRFQMWGRPSISVRVETAKPSYALGEVVSATTFLANAGDADPFGEYGHVDWYVDGLLVPSEEDGVKRENLRPGIRDKIETAALSLPSQYGTHEIKACFRFDKEDFVEERDPADNCAVATVSVPDPNPPVAVMAPKEPAEPLFDPTTPGTALWHNNGITSLEQSCGATPQDPDFTVSPALQAGDLGATLNGIDRQKIFIPAVNAARIGLGFWNAPTLDPTKIAKWCWGSNQTGWGIGGSSACGVPVKQSSGTWYVDIPNTPRASKGTWSIGYNGTEYWAKADLWTSDTLDTDGHLRYGGWDFNRMTLETNADGYYVLTADFGAFGLPGFWLPPDATITNQAFWHTDGDGGIPGTILCNPATGKLSLSITGATPGSTGRVILGTNTPSVYGWQGTDWLLPTGLGFDTNGTYTLPTGQTVKSLKLDAVYDAGAKRLTLTVPGQALMTRAFWNAENTALLTNKAVFQTWIGSDRDILGTVTVSAAGSVTIVFEGIQSGEGGSVYLVRSDSVQSWQNNTNWNFGNGIVVAPDGGSYVMP